MDEFAPYLKINGCFIVLNISPQVKVIRIFNYPILYGKTRDLLAIPGVAENDIRASLLKGELQHKILAKDIIIICSDIDLLQFNDAQKAFLQSAGIMNGLTIQTGKPTGDVALVTSNYLVQTTDSIIAVGTLSGGITVTLPASPNAGDTYIIKDVVGGAGTNNITVSGNGINIDNNSNFVLNVNFESITVAYTGTTWNII